MVVIHRVFRREFQLLPRMVRAVPDGDVERAREVAAHADEMLDALRQHHENEDALIWPKLRARAEVPQSLVYLMESQHAAVAEFVQVTRQLLHPWAATASQRSREELAVVLDNLSGVLGEHLDDEERSVLPIVGRTMTSEQWEVLRTRGAENVPQARLSLILGAVLEGASEEERAAFLKNVPLTVRLMYRLIGRRRYDDYCALLRRDLEYTPAAEVGPGTPVGYGTADR